MKQFLIQISQSTNLFPRIYNSLSATAAPKPNLVAAILEEQTTREVRVKIISLVNLLYTNLTNSDKNGWQWRLLDAPHTTPELKIAGKVSIISKIWSSNQP